MRLRLRILAVLVLLVPLVVHAAVTVTVNGSNYSIPQTNEKGWGTNVTTWIQAISQNTLQPSGGAFTLSAEVDFGSSYGLKSLYYKSRGLNVSSSGILRLANAETIGWRNATNDGNLLLTANSSDQLTFNGNPILGSSALTGSRALVSTSGGVISASSVTSTELGYLSGVTSSVQTQIDAIDSDATQTLTNKTIDADGTGNSITNIENADIKSGANIARSKLASGSASHVVINDGSGNFSSEAQLAISRGGTGQSTASAGFDALAPTTTKGDLIGYSTTNARLGVGSDGQILTADSAQAVGFKWADAPAAPSASYELSNVGIGASVGSNALTISLKQADGSTDCSAGAPCKIGFRSATAGSGAYNQRTITSSLSTTISSGSTAGHISGAQGFLFIYAVDNSGTVELAWSSKVFDDSIVQSTTAEGGAGGADSGTTLYSTTARTDVPIKLIGRILSGQTTAGTWASAPLGILVGRESALMPQDIEVSYNSGNGYGSGGTKIRKYTTEVRVAGQIASNNSATDGLTITILTPGLYSFSRGDRYSGGANWIGVSVNASGTTTALTSLSASQRLDLGQANAANFVINSDGVARLNIGDIIRPHDEAACDETLAYASFFKLVWIGW